MAVSKRTRYEVLRRDNFTCRYCRSSDNPLTVDHVTPVALGGSDKPDNLVAACKDCNYGKASSSPDSTMVADVSEDAVRWSKAIETVAKARRADKRKRNAYVTHFNKQWDRWRWGRDREHAIPKPADWKTTIWQLYELGLPRDEVSDAVQIACGNSRVDIDATFRYFCGVCYRKMEDIHDAARSVAGVDADGA